MQNENSAATASSSSKKRTHAQSKASTSSSKKMKEQQEQQDLQQEQDSMVVDLAEAIAPMGSSGDLSLLALATAASASNDASSLLDDEKTILQKMEEVRRANEPTTPASSRRKKKEPATPIISTKKTPVRAKRTSAASSAAAASAKKNSSAKKKKDDSSDDDDDSSSDEESDSSDEDSDSSDDEEDSDDDDDDDSSDEDDDDDSDSSEDEDDDDDSEEESGKKSKGKGVAKSSSSSSSAKAKGKAAKKTSTTKKKAAASSSSAKKGKKEKKSSGQTTEKPKKSSKKKASTSSEATSSSKKSSKRKSGTDAEEEEEEVYKWWLDENLTKTSGGKGNKDESRWKTLQHAGVLFPPAYVPHKIPIKYDGQTVTLTPEQEEVATMYAVLKGSDWYEKEVFKKNFFKDWLAILNQGLPANKPHIITDLSKCDFSAIQEWYIRDKEAKKARSSEEKKKDKEERAKIEKPFMYALIDGRKEKVGNFRVEPPGLFRGRGAHPKMGTLKRRVQPEDVTINIGEKDKVPEPPAGHKWKAVIHNHTVTWLAFWKDNVNDDTKYVFLSPQSSFKGKSDFDKFETARSLKNKIDQIRKDYTNDLDSKVDTEAQRATALYFIDKLALRVGNEKDEDEADTVGCCSLRVEHIKLIAPNKVEFDFLGKDSIRYQNTVEVDKKVYANVEKFIKGKKPGDTIFHLISTTLLNKYLHVLMPKLTAKVFRTFNASFTLDKELRKDDLAKKSLVDKLAFYNAANKQVAILCNHQKTVSKAHGDQVAKLDSKLKELREQKTELENALKVCKSKGYEQAKNYYSQVQDARLKKWDEEHKLTSVKAEVKTEVKTEKQASQASQASTSTATPSSSASSSLSNNNNNNDVKSEIKSEVKTEKASDPKKPAKKPLPAEDKIASAITKLDEKIQAQEAAKNMKEDLKAVALGTSKINYLDPRITVAWCKRQEVPIEKIFNQSLRKKFPWAMDVNKDFAF